MTEERDEQYEARRAKVAEEVKKLLAKAASTEYEAERETFEAAAASKMKRWMIDEAALRGDLENGLRGAGDVVDEQIPVPWEDGLGRERAQLLGGVGRAFGTDGVILLRDGGWSRPMAAYVRIHMYGTRAALDAVKALYPGLLLQCEIAGERAWQEKLEERRRLHRERELRPPGAYWDGNPHFSGYTTRDPFSMDYQQMMDVISGHGQSIGPGLCRCGCGEPVDDAPVPLFSFAGVYSQATTSGMGSAAARLVEQRTDFLKSFILGWAATVEQRLTAMHGEAESAEEQADAERFALVRASDAERAGKALINAYPNTVRGDGVGDHAAYWSGASNAHGADLGGARFGDGYGARRELSA